MISAVTPEPSGPDQILPTSGKSVLRTLLVILFGGAIAVLNTGLSYLTIGTTVIPILVGFVLCLFFAVAVRLLHGARWLSVLSIVPAVFVLVGSVQLAPELALEQRGVRQEVSILADRGVGTSHIYVLLSDESGVLSEPLTYGGDNSPYRVGDHLTVLVDPRGVVELEDAARVDVDGEFRTLVIGVVGWTLVALLAGWRGHRRRHRRPRQLRPSRGGDSLIADMAGGFLDGD
jgi:hypothetical protein